MGALTHRLLLAAVFSAASCALCSGAAGDQPLPARWNRYEDGPLASSDFQRETESSEPAATLAVWTELRFRSRYRFSRQGGLVVATLEAIDVYAVVDRERSWCRDQLDAYWLDYAQGFFDLMHVAALRAAADMRGRVKAGQVWQGTGPDENEAIADLERKIRAWLAPFAEEARRQQQQYQQDTRAGLDRQRVAAERQQQRRQIAHLGRGDDNPSGPREPRER